MATIRKRGDSYQIRVSCGYDMNGRQVIRTKSWKPTASMTAKQIEKELNRQAVMFENACMNGFMTSATKFAEFAERWKSEYAKNNLKQTSIDNMSHTIKRINEEIGHFRLDKINTQIIQNLIISLLNGNEKQGKKPLCAQTVKNYISYVSSVFNYAIRLEMILKNPCRNAVIPTVKNNKRDMYSLDEAQTFIDTLIKKAPLVYQCYFILAIYSGFRRGELGGLTWDNIDFTNHIITVEKALYHIKDKGNVLDATKHPRQTEVLNFPI
ncbi:MAG: phage integrase SAM-like domain-containing protein [Oscillospiraceae bacterium]|nr:phage integrase SAM-like domain-containing protein [Oscillospiraceae bacterium]